MDVVALTELATAADTEAVALAGDLGLTAYEAGQRLAVGMPCVVLLTPDRARAMALLSALRARGHGAMACDGKAVTASARMRQVRRFHFEPDALVLEENRDSPATLVPEDRVPYAEMLALVRAAHRRIGTTHEETTEKKFRPAAALASGGVILTKTVKHQVVRTLEHKEQVLYVFRRGGPSVLLREGMAQYAGLGAALTATRVQNFLTAVRLLREHAPSIPYDDRLLRLKKPPEPPNDRDMPRAFDRETGGVDLLAHLLAMWMSR